MSNTNQPAEQPNGQSNASRNEREVIDPIAHLPVIIHDNTDEELGGISSRPPTPQGNTAQSVLRDVMAGVVWQEAESERWKDVSAGKAKMQIAMFTALAVGAGSSVTLWLFCILGRGWPYGLLDLFRAAFLCGLVALASGGAIMFVKHPALQPAEHPHKHEEQPKSTESPEPAQWLNGFLGSLWPIVNPSLFVSISDMLEDALQASLPKMIKGVRVADIGQGTEPLRILGIRALQSDEIKDTDDGNFVRLELAVAYRAQSTETTGLKDRSKNAHLLMQFWLAGSVMVPIWVELSGIIATVRVRLQLTPDPPFLSSMTLTMLGQPKLALKCTPLAKNFLNVMDVPGLSGWLHQTINDTISMYVAPRSISLDLKTILSGKEKQDSEALGIVVVNVKSATGYKDGDGGKIWKSKDGRGGDVYVTVGWGKWGKPLWSTRILENELNPVWDETTYLLVTPADLNAEEKLRLQLWDSDRFTADDLLGTVEVTLKQIMDSPNKISQQKDGIRGADGSSWPGSIEWSFGYFEKTNLQQHLSKSAEEIKELEGKLSKDTKAELREAPNHDEEQNHDIQAQEKKDFLDKANDIIAGSPPSADWPTGVLYFRIDDITGLEVQKVRESGVKNGGEDEESDDLPSTYCTVIINHQRVYKTRTKMKNAKPLFNAGTERIIKDWRNTLVMIAVRDYRLHEPDPLLGVVVLPLHKLFKERSQVSDSLPLVGGVGFGRLRFAIGFRSIQAQLPKTLLGWDVGTLEIRPEVTVSGVSDHSLMDDLKSCKIIMRTLYGKDKLYPGQDKWTQKRGRPIHIPVKKRYASCLLLTFKKKVLGPDLTPAFCTLWLKDIPDDEETKVNVAIHRNTDDTLARARNNAVDDVGERVGELHLTLKFWPGLSGYHQNLSDQDSNMEDVMEILDGAEESEEVPEQDIEYASSSSSSSSSSDEGQGRESGLKGEFKNYRKRKGELHRKHRGLMQWSAARRVAWIGRGVENKADEVASKVKGLSKHKQLEGGIEKEA